MNIVTKILYIKMILKFLSLLPHFIFKKITKNIDKKQKRDHYEQNFDLKKISNSLFNNHQDFFIQLINQSNVYGEYGSGYSTLYAVDIAKKKTFSSETSKNWSETIKDNIETKNLLNLLHVDVGDVSNWGWPINYSKSENFKAYFNHIWDHEIKPDFVLIDGRFRVATFLTTLKYAEKNTIVLFDDYIKRKQYEVVEIFEKPYKTNERQAIFKVSKNYNLDDLDFYISKFEFVME